MSLKRDNFNSLDKKYMRIAINLAKNQNGLTGTNPSVGCVIVKNNKIISYSATNITGRPHAETIALRKNRNKNYGSTLYITLEPCSHYGKTPPCTNAIIKSKIKKVIYSVEDSDIRSSNKSKKILRSKKIQVKSGLLKNEIKNFYKDYNYSKEKKLPYVIGKLACSSNSFILKNKTFITNTHSRMVSHLLRYKSQGILTSYKTINSDNPKLTCIIGLSSEPERLVDIRKNRMNSLKETENRKYTDIENIKKEVFNAKKTFQKYKWPLIDVTRKSVEETAASIIKIHEIYLNNAK